MRILGIDPGLAIVGWGVIDYEASKFKTVAYGALRTPAGICTEERLRLIYSGMQELLREYRPDAMAIEELFFHTNVTTGIRVAEARGVLLLAAHQAGFPVKQNVIHAPGVDGDPVKFNSGGESFFQSGDQFILQCGVIPVEGVFFFHRAVAEAVDFLQ